MVRNYLIDSSSLLSSCSLLSGINLFSLMCLCFSLVSFLRIDTLPKKFVANIYDLHFFVLHTESTILVSISCGVSFFLIQVILCIDSSHFLQSFFVFFIMIPITFFYATFSLCLFYDNFVV